MQGGCLDAHPCFGTSIHAFAETLDGVWMERGKTYISGDRASMLHPGLGGWSSRCQNRIQLVVLIILHQTLRSSNESRVMARNVFWADGALDAKIGFVSSC